MHFEPFTHTKIYTVGEFIGFSLSILIFLSILFYFIHTFLSSFLIFFLFFILLILLFFSYRRASHEKREVIL